MSFNTITYSPSKYLLQRAPLEYGGQQGDYQQRAQRAINAAVSQITSCERTESALSSLFGTIFDQFRGERRSIAQAHETRLTSRFGQRRDTEGELLCFQTCLTDRYSEYGNRLLRRLGQEIRGLNLATKSIQEKKITIEDNICGRTSRLEIEILEQGHLAARGWNFVVTPAGMVPSNCTFLRPSFPFEAAKKVAEGHMLTEKEHAHLREQMKAYKAEDPKGYQQHSFSVFMTKMMTEFPSRRTVTKEDGVQQEEIIDSNLRSFFLLATSRFQVGNKMYAVSQYFTWLYRDFITPPVDRMIACSKVSVLHQDPFLIDDTLKEISQLFAQAVLVPSGEERILKERVALFTIYFARCMPLHRGSQAVGEWLEAAIYGAHEYEVSYDPKRDVNLEALSVFKISDFISAYMTMVTLKPKSRG